MDNLHKTDNQKVGGGQFHHSFTDEEVIAYSEHINWYLKDDAACAEFLPIDPNTMDLFGAMGDGIILCKLINLAGPGTIDPRAINVKKPLNIFNKGINLNLAIESAKSIGVVVVSVQPSLITEKREHIILGLLWQIIKIQSQQNINLKTNPFLIRLKHEDEEFSDLLKLNPEELLLRWFNFHLGNSSYGKTIKNFSKDLQDGLAYTHLLNQLDKSKCDKSGIEMSVDDRAIKVLKDGVELGVPTFLRPINITGGHPKLNLLFCAQLFNHCPGLQASEEDYAAAKMLNEDNDPESSQEERVFKMWINSLNIEDLYVNHLFEDLKDGTYLCKIEDKLVPGSVNWKSITKPAKHRIVKVQNCNYAIEVAQKLKIHCELIGGLDIVDGNKKLVLGVIWQFFRMDVLKTLGSLTDDQILHWANDRVAEEYRVLNFKDPKVRKGHLFFRVLETIEPRCIDWDFVQPGDTPEEIENNAKYIISVGRRLGMTVFITWEQIRDGKAKMLAAFIASMMCFSKIYETQKKHAKEAKIAEQQQ